MAALRDQLDEARRVVVPPREDPHGPLPPLLLVLTAVTGLVDAFSYLALGHVLVANMTGNVVFLAFAVGHALGFVWWASLLAIGTFLLGALAGGRIARRHGAHRGHHLAVAVAVETVLVAVALVVSLAGAAPYDGWRLGLLVALLGVALGVQNATARALAVSDLTTTVLTLTLTGIAADSRPAAGGSSRIGRRLVPITAMFVGGLVGALLVVHGRGAVDLVLAAVLLGVVVVVAAVASTAAGRSGGVWTSRP